MYLPPPTYFGISAFRIMQRTSVIWAAAYETKIMRLQSSFFFNQRPGLLNSLWDFPLLNLLPVRSSESDVPHLALNYTFLSFICREGDFGLCQVSCRLPCTFLLFWEGTGWLVYTMTETRVFPPTQMSILSSKGTVALCPGSGWESLLSSSAAQWHKGFSQLYHAAGPNPLPYWSRCTEICQVLARESWNKTEDVAKCSVTATYFNVTVCKPRDLSYPRRTAPGFNFASNNQLNTFTHRRKGRNHVEQESAWSWQKLWGVCHTW